MTRMIKELIKLANHLDSRGLIKEADYLDEIIKKAETYENSEENNENNIESYQRFYSDKTVQKHYDDAWDLATKAFSDNIYEEVFNFIKRKYNLKEISEDIKYGYPLTNFQQSMLKTISTLESDLYKGSRDSIEYID